MANPFAFCINCANKIEWQYEIELASQKKVKTFKGFSCPA